MMFQRETTRCDRCHNVLFFASIKSTSEGDPYCPACGYVFGTSVAPSSWSCDCGALVIHHGGDNRPYCLVCETPMNCRRATASLVHGVGTGIKDLDQGLTLLYDAQLKPGGMKENYRVLLKLGVAETAVVRQKELDLGLEILKDMQNG